MGRLCTVSLWDLFDDCLKANREYVGTSKYDSGRTMEFAALRSDWTTERMSNRHYWRLVQRRIRLIYLIGFGKTSRKHYLCHKENAILLKGCNLIRRDDGVTMIACA